MTSPIRGTLHGSPSLAGVERLVLMRWMDKMCFYSISCANCLHHTRYFFYIGTYRSYHPTFCTYMEDNVYRGLGCNAFASPSFFLEYAGELRIFVLRRRNMVPYKHRLLTPDRAVRGC
jgi:hypothetical protein